MSDSVPIQIDFNTWVIMRLNPSKPAAMVERVTHANGTVRYMLFSWRGSLLDRRLRGIYDSLEDADAAVPTPKESLGRTDGKGGWPPGAHGDTSAQR